MYVDEDNDFCDRCGKKDTSQLVGGDSNSEVKFGWHADGPLKGTHDLCLHCMKEVNLKPCYVCDKWMPADDDANYLCSKECEDEDEDDGLDE